MKRSVIAFLLIAAGMGFTACQKNSDVFVPDPGQTNGPDTNWYSTITPTMPVSNLRNSLAFGYYTDSIQVSNTNAYITTPFGLVCGFPPNCCVSTGGTAVTGTVHVELTLIKKKGDMIRLNKPTVSGNRLLISGGEIFIRLKKDNQELQLAPNVKLILRYPDVPLMNGMKIYTGDETVPGPFTWNLAPDPLNNTVAVSNQNYEIQTNKLRWINNASLVDTVGIPQTRIHADLANNFTNANTIVFAVFKDFRSVIELVPDLGMRKFTSIRVPVGKEITLVAISRQGNDFFMAHKTLVTTTLPANTVTQAVPLTPVITSLASVLDYLNTL